jgi:hypothetical protein
MSNPISSFFNPQEGFQSAEEQMQKFFEMMQKYGQDANNTLNPYNQNGMNQYGRLNNQANELGDPQALENKWASGYSESPYAQQMTKEATAGGLDAASSMGLMGSSAALSNIQKSAGNIMQSDRQAYMDDLMKKYMASVGIGKNLYGVGANAAGGMSANDMNMGTNAMNMGQTMGGLKYGETNAPGEMFGKLAGGAADIGLNWATGGMSGAAEAAGRQFGGKAA